MSDSSSSAFNRERISDGLSNSAISVMSRGETVDADAGSRISMRLVTCKSRVWQLIHELSPCVRATNVMQPKSPFRILRRLQLRVQFAQDTLAAWEIREDLGDRLGRHRRGHATRESDQNRQSWAFEGGGERGGGELRQEPGD